ncbi:S-phase kinase-associated protein 2 [Anopheles maculipalpis]|uniref:S-phase kinase-associated protein 2 n=1 Tax=Anopheles maculipalpis TaxID=1496333 RepID=UPI00215971DE|nr:S-phase kinase-associated protein 2 [Anopheles maculipalpis]
MDPPTSKGRLPLTNVSNTVNPRPCKSNVMCDELMEEQSKSMARENDETFFMFRKDPHKTTVRYGNLFDLLSDEVILHILKWLPKKTLITCSQVNRRLNRVSKDETLWYRVDLSNRTLQFQGLVEVLSRGVIVLRLAQTSIVNPVLGPFLDHPTKIKVQYLDLSMCTISKPILHAVLSKCRELVKLSLENVPLDDAICLEISKNQGLETLNLTMCSGIDARGIQFIAKSLTKLHSFNVSWTNLSVGGVRYLVQNLTPQIVHLNLAGCRSTMTDGDVAILTTRCPKLVALDLSDCTLLTEAVIKTLCKARKIEYLSLSRCYNIHATAYLNLRTLKTLRFLDLFGLVSDQAIETLRHSLTDVGINKYYHSSVARPTVGTKRTSIWGLRTRD